MKMLQSHPIANNDNNNDQNNTNNNNNPVIEIVNRWWKLSPLFAQNRWESIANEVEGLLMSNSLGSDDFGIQNNSSNNSRNNNNNQSSFSMEF